MFEISITKINGDTEWINNTWDGQKSSFEKMIESRWDTIPGSNGRIPFMVFEGSVEERHMLHQKLQKNFKHVSYQVDGSDNKKLMIISNLLTIDGDEEIDTLYDGDSVKISSKSTSNQKFVARKKQQEVQVKSRRRNRIRQSRRNRIVTPNLPAREGVRPSTFWSRNFYPLYILVSSIIVTYLMSMPCDEFIEGCRLLGDNATMDDVHEVYRQIMTDGSSYDQNCLTIWWKALFLFTIVGGYIRTYHCDD